MLKRQDAAACILGVLVVLLMCLGATGVLAQETKPTPTKVEPTSAPKDSTPAPTSIQKPSQAQRLSAIFKQVKDFEQLKVSFVDGVMTIEGKVSSAVMRDQAVALARKIDGVLYVQSLVTVSQKEAQTKPKTAKQVQSSQDEMLESKLRAIFADVSSFTQVKVDVSAGVVHLTGRVPTKEEQEKLTALVGKMDGVIYVDNQTQEITQLAERISPAAEKAKQLVQTTISKLPLYGLGVVIFFFFWWLSGAITGWSFLFKRWADKPLVREIIKQILRTVIFVTGILIILELFGITTLVGAVLGTAGVAGVALGFAFRDIVENYLASVLLSMRQPFRKGDFIQIDTHMGSVMRMTTRDTVLMTSDGNHVRIPNAQVFKSVLYNYSLNPNRRFDFVVGVGVAESLREVRTIAMGVLEDLDGILEDPSPYMVIDDLGDFSVLCHFYAWIDQRNHDRLAVRTEAIRRVKLALEQQDVDMPEPIQRRYIYQMGEQVNTALTRESKARQEHIEDDSWKGEANEDKQLQAQAMDESGLENEPDLLE